MQRKDREKGTENVSSLHEEGPRVFINDELWALYMHNVPKRPQGKKPRKGASDY